MNNIIPYITVFVIFLVFFIKFKPRILNFKRVKSDKLLCKIIKEGQKATIVKVNRSKKWFNNPNKEDGTKYNINIDKHFLNVKNEIIILYRYGETEPISFTPSSKLMLFSKDIKNTIESRIIQDFKASVTNKLFSTMDVSTMDVKLTIILFISAINLLAIILFIAIFYQFKEEITPIITFFIENKETLLP